MASLLELQRDFERFVKRDRVSHAYLLFGRSRSVQFEFAKFLARFLETGTWEGNGPLLDAMVLDGRETPLGIEIARSVQHFLYQMPVRSKHRFLAIAHAEALTVPAAQALLTIVEEPPANARILLAVLDPSVLLPALASRFQKLYLASEPDPPSPEAKALAQEFFRADLRSRRELIKELVEQGTLVYDFLGAVMARLGANPVAHAGALREFLGRLSAMRQWNTNRRLQIEAALLDVLSHQ